MSYRYHGSNRPETIHIRWVLKDGKEEIEPAAIGDSLMEAAQRHDIPIEGACAGVCACSTCHVILERKMYDNLPEPSEAEEDMLDQAYGLTATSRLGCQVKITADMDDIRVTLPKATRNFYVVSTSKL
ncbi:2Fe-2S iron-sulfur cluster binding domain-containing protein [archaeon]|nr:MAG: 2Fe-2S iron-sulfur cluster binding domain-containing protein [archaeon]